MSSLNFTPWKIKPSTQYIGLTYILDSRGFTIAKCTDASNQYCDEDAEAKRIAKMMAAAPELVKALKNMLMARLGQQLGTGGFTRVVMGCEMLIKQVCDPTQDHLALKPVYGAAPEMLEALQYLSRLHPRRCMLAEVTRARAAIAHATGVEL